MDKCHICNQEHEMVATPFMWNGIHCPYDASHKSLINRDLFRLAAENVIRKILEQDTPPVEIKIPPP